KRHTLPGTGETEYQKAFCGVSSKAYYNTVRCKLPISLGLSAMTSSPFQLDQHSIVIPKPIIAIPTLPKPNPILLALGSDKKKVPSRLLSRKICKNCKCSKDDHDIPPSETDPGKLRIGKLFERAPTDLTLSNVSGEKLTTLQMPDKNGVCVSLMKFDWIPPNITQELAEKFMYKIPAEKRPIANSDGAVNRRLALEKQLPLYDYDSTACHAGLDDDERKCMDKFVDRLRKQAIGQGQIDQVNTENRPVLKFPSSDTDDNENNAWKCFKCEGKLEPGEVVVFAERAGPKVCWHPGCFVCTECKELLVDLIYFYKDSKIYCGRHFGNLLFPRCSGCDELIFAKEYTMAEERNWHVQHFCCYNCDTHLGGKRYVCKHEQPYCLDCYKLLFARLCVKKVWPELIKILVALRKTCEFCREKIAADVHRISHDNLHWHAKSECFFCCYCKISLLKQKYVVKNGKIFCTIDCKNRIFPS
uniref:Testin n=1 Tax=Romanomermis culicivorax TaxID=13658 RepID=A0A915HY73_ROMCU